MPNRSLFFENRSLFFESRTLFLSKIGVCFLKIGVCFYLFFDKRSMLLSKIGVCFLENRSLFFWKSGFDFWKSELVFFENQSWFFENPSIGPRFWAAILLLSSNKISGGSREGAGEPAPPPLYFWTKLRPEKQKNFLETTPLLISGSGCPPPLIWRSLFQFSLTYGNKRPGRFI